MCNPVLELSPSHELESGYLTDIPNEARGAAEVTFGVDSSGADFVRRGRFRY